MNSARHLIRRMTTGSSALRNFRYTCSVFEKSLSGSPLSPQASQGINRFTPAVCLRMKSTAACRFEVINVQDEGDFKKRVLDASNCTPVIVDFHATWCGPCKILGPRLESILAEEAGKVVMAKVDIDDNADLAMEYGVRSVPTVMAVKDGKVQSQFIGVIDDDQIRSFVDKLIIS